MKPPNILAPVSGWFTEGFDTLGLLGTSDFGTRAFLNGDYGAEC